MPVGRGSSVRIATRYGLDGPGIESRWEGGDISAPAQTGPGGPTQPPIQRVRDLSGGEGGDKAAGAWR